jgi:hypothetical protein
LADYAEYAEYAEYASPVYCNGTIGLEPRLTSFAASENGNVVEGPKHGITHVTSGYGGVSHGETFRRIHIYPCGESTSTHILGNLLFSAHA